MIPADLLSALREKDPELWERINRVYAMRYMRQIDDPQILEFLTGKEKQSLIQGYLQEAIRARGCSGWVGRTALICFAEIHTKGAASRFENNEIFYGQGDTEAEALGWAYLAVIEGTCQSAAGLAG